MKSRRCGYWDSTKRWKRGLCFALGVNGSCRRKHRLQNVSCSPFACHKPRLPLTSLSGAEYTTILAIAGASGPTKILQITLLDNDELHITEQHSILPSPKVVTALKWLGGPSPRLAIGRLSEVSIWSEESSHTVAFPMEEYRGWTSLASPIELLHYPARDTLVASLSDGTFRVIASISSSPVCQRLSAVDVSPSFQMSEAAHQSFTCIEKAALLKRGTTVPAHIAMHVYGCQPLDESSGTVIWIWERHVQDNKVYHMANLHKMSWVAGRLFDDDEAEEGGLADRTLRVLAGILKNPQPGR